MEDLGNSVHFSEGLFTAFKLFAETIVTIVTETIVITIASPMPRCSK